MVLNEVLKSASLQQYRVTQCSIDGFSAMFGIISKYEYVNRYVSKSSVR